MTPTEIQLFVLHRGPTAQLEDICEKYLSLSPAVARQYAGLNKLPFPTFRAGSSNKSPLLVKLADLAKHIDERRDAAAKQWERSQV